MSPLSFLILGAVLPMRRLHNVKQEGVPLRVRVKQGRQQRAISARKEEPQVHNAEQGVRLQANNVGVAALQVCSVRLGLLRVDRCQLAVYRTEYRDFGNSWMTEGEVRQNHGQRA
jgi:hypothetical protein